MMRPFSAAELLSIWEQGRAANPIRRALLLLAGADHAISYETLKALSLGQRDRALLILRAWTFGPHFSALSTCPACNERIELNFSVSDILVEQTSDIPESIHIAEDEYEINFRLPNSKDLELVFAQSNQSNITEMILQRCILNVLKTGKEYSKTKLPQTVVKVVLNRMNEIDPQANIQLSLTCPQCQHHWLGIFDIVSFLWNEINAWANRILREVHLLASTYGWRETDILSMTPQRRQKYLELILQ